MPRSLRKQRELAEREDLLLDIAKSLIAKKGFAALAMDQIAEEAAYSKGTIYQHFPNKEEVLIRLAMRGAPIWNSFFKRALAFRGRSRERVVALHYGHLFYALLYPIEYQANYAAKTWGICEKISPESHAAHEAILKANIDSVAVVVDEAVRAGDLVLPLQISVRDLVYALWGAHYGGLMLQAQGFSYERMGIANKEGGARLVFRYLLDGLGWRPLSSDYDYEATAERVLSEVFPDEHKALQTKRGASDRQENCLN